MAIVSLAIKSLRNRTVTAVLTIASIALSVILLLGVERIRHQARTSFTSTISGTDLIVGARTSPVQLLLSSVFRLSDASNTIRWESYETIASRPEVAWSIPISLGDSHRGYRVVGTSDAYFQHLRYGRKQALRMQEGTWFNDVDGAVLGSEAAANLGYRIGDEIVVAHGSGDVSFIEHDKHPFRVTGILAPTGTPVDRSVHASLAGIDAIHAGMDPGHDHDPLTAHADTGHLQAGHDRVSAAGTRHALHEPAAITAFFVGLRSRASALGVQRMVNEYNGEPLTAILPAAALQELWEIVGVVEKALLAVSGFVVLVGLAGMLVALMTSLNERRREMAILRSVGARPVHVFGLIVGEAGFVTLAGVAAGIVVLYGLLLAAQPLIASRFGLFIGINGLSIYELILVGIVCVAGFIIGIIPGYRVYRYSLADGMTVKL